MQDLINKLKELRINIANDNNIPPYCVFQDKDILELIKVLPLNLNELSKIKGFKENKIKKCGEYIIDTISDFLKNSEKNRDEILFEINNQFLNKIDIKAKLSKEEEKIIFDCIKEFNGIYGKTGIIKILKSSNTITDGEYKEKFYSKAISSKYFGCLKQYPRKIIEEIIDKYIQENKVFQTKGPRPTLVVPELNYKL